MIEANRASSSANEVNMSTLVSGLCARISRVASIPLPSARRTSITITSGRARSAWTMASLTVPASATTRTSPAASSMVLRPLRTTSWSSTSMSRSRPRSGLSSPVIPLLPYCTVPMHFHMRCSDGTAAEGPFRIGAFGTLGGVASSAYANDRYIAEGTQGRDRSGYEESELAVADPVVELGVLFQQHDRQG